MSTGAGVEDSQPHDRNRPQGEPRSSKLGIIADAEVARALSSSTAQGYHHAEGMAENAAVKGAMEGPHMELRPGHAMQAPQRPSKP